MQCVQNGNSKIDKEHSKEVAEAINENIVKWGKK